MDFKEILSLREYLELQNSSFAPDLCMIKALFHIWDIRNQHSRARIKGMWIMSFTSMSEAREHFNTAGCAKLKFTTERFDPDDLESDSFFVLIDTGKFAYKYKSKDNVVDKSVLEAIKDSTGSGNDRLIEVADRQTFPSDKSD